MIDLTAEGRNISVSPYFRLMRPLNALVAGIAAVIGYLMATGTVTPGALLLTGIVFLVTGAGNAVNDYYDVEIDRINRPGRPIPSGAVRREGALTFAVILFILGILTSLFTNPICISIAVFNSILLVLYAASLKGKPVAGNVVISYISASIFLFGGAYAGLDGVIRVAPVALITFLAMLSRELWKDAEDVAGDSACGADTVPIRIGVKKTVVIGFIFLIGAVMASIVPVFWWGPLYLAGIFPVDIAMLCVGVRALSCATPGCLIKTRATDRIKYLMYASLVVFTLAAVLL